MSVKIGLTLLLIGIFLIIKPILPLSYFTYSFLIWGMIFVLDYANIRRWKRSVMSDDLSKFWGLYVPISVLFWLFFEFSNFLYTQWDYLGIPTNILIGFFMSFIAYSTVIPFVIEVCWLLIGPVDSFFFYYMPKRQKLFIFLFPLLGIILLGTYILTSSFWFAQSMWLVPFFLFFPFIAFEKTNHKHHIRYICSLVISILISGLLWESFNYFAETKWQYLIFKNAPHIFQMPVIGYIGYIPFIFSLVSVFLFVKKNFRFSPILIIFIYAFTALVTLVYVNLYLTRFLL